jgi:hypothetical protein
MEILKRIKRIKNGFLLKEKGCCDPAKKQTRFLFSDKEGVD